MKRYYWLKLKDDFFTQPKIKKLRRIAGGDTFTIIYLKLQLLSLKDEGKLYFDEIEETFAEEIALTIDEEVDNVNITLQYLKSQGLIEEVTEDELIMTETEQLIGSESDSAGRVRRHRERKTLQGDTNNSIDASDTPSGKGNRKNYSCEFEEFWSIYPRKVDKGSAYKKFMTRVKTGFREDELIQAAKNYAEECENNGTEKRYIKHAATFLSDSLPFTDYLNKPDESEPTMGKKDDYWQ